MQGVRDFFARVWPRGAWSVAAASLLAAALVLWPTVGADAAFAAAALGVVAWFLNVREQLKLKNPEAFADVETTDDEDTDVDDNDEEPDDYDEQTQGKDSRPT